MVPTISGVFMEAPIPQSGKQARILVGKGAGDSGHRMMSGMTGSVGQSGVTGYALNSGIPAR